MKNADNSCSNTLLNKVKINLNMFGALMLYGIGRHADSADVVAVNKRSPTDRHMQLNKKLAQPRNLCDSIGDSSVFGFSAGMRDCSLALRRPGYEIIAKEDSIPKSRLAGVRTSSPIGIGVNHKIRLSRWA